MAITAEMRTKVAQLYVSLFGRAPERDGLAYWVGKLDSGSSFATVAQEMYNTEPARATYPLSMTNEEIVAKFYTNVLGRTADAEGLAYWTGKLNATGATKGSVIVDMITAVVNYTGTDANGLASKALFNNKVDVGLFYGFETNNNDVLGASKILSGVTADPATVAAAKQSSGVILTNGTDKVTGTLFEAGLVYTPGGDDRINALQSEDVLTGSGASNTLNATLGNSNDNGSASVTPTLTKIHNVNVEATGGTKTLDLRFADSLQKLALNKITAEAGNTFTFDNISQNVADLTVKNSAQVNNTVNFDYVDGVLAAKNAQGTAAGGDVGAVAVSNVNLAALNIGNDSDTEGFETLTLTSTGTNTIKNFEANDLETLTIKGSGSLNIVDRVTANERVDYTAAGLTVGDGIGIRSIDATGFTGNVNLDITNAVGGKNDPGNSGVQFFTDIKMGAGNDVLWTNKAATGTTTLNDKIDGGAGADTLRTYAGVGSNAKITNVETLDMRNDGNSKTSHISSFDANLKKVVLRNETTGNTAATFVLESVTAALAVSDIELRHSVTNTATESGAGDVVEIKLASTSGTADAAALTVVNDLNKGTTYNYTLKASGVETVTVNDNDTETNQLTLTNASSHKTALNLTGGTAGLDYVVSGTVIAKTLDASTQKSNLTLTVGTADQVIKLGSGNDLLTFDGLDTFNGSDSLTDVSGTDTVRAAFSKDVAGTPTLSGIEKLQIIANENATIDLANGTGITELAILSDKAVDSANEIFTAAVTGVAITDIITLKNTNLTSVNFFGDADGTNADGGDANSGKDSAAYTQTFNGLTLNNNASTTLAVKIAAPLANGADSASSGDGIKNYNLGQLTTHGVTDMTIAVSNEYNNSASGSDYSGDTTTIANIWDRDLVNLTISAKGNFNVGTVTGNTVNSNIKKFDASAVGGKTTAVVKALGDAAVVTLGVGDDTFNGLGSAGNNVVIQGGDGKNTITGTAQSDYIYTGTGNDTISADRGNNTVKSGAGNDTVTALNGSNTVDLGSGLSDKVTFRYDTVAQRDLATNGVAGSGTSAVIGFDDNNDGTAETTFGFAVGEGAELSLKFTGIVFDSVASTLNGRSANVSAASAFTGVEANLSNLLVATDAGGVALTTINGGSAADVFFDARTAAGDADAYDVSTGAGNDAIIIAQTSTAIHTITGGTGADRVYLSAAAGVDTIVIGENESTASAWDVITNFKAGADKLNVSGTPTKGATANLTSTQFSATGPITAVAVDGAFSLSSGVIGKDHSVSSVLSFLASNATVSGDVFFFQYDSDGDGTITAADNVIVFQNLGTDIVVELVGGNGNNVNGLVFGDFS